MGSNVSSFFGTVKSTVSGIASGAKAVASGVASGVRKASNSVQRNRTNSGTSRSSLFFRKRRSALGPRSLSGSSYKSNSLFSSSPTRSSFSSTNPLQSIATGIGVGFAKNAINSAVYSRPRSKSLSSINQITEPVQNQNLTRQNGQKNPATPNITRQNGPKNPAPQQITQNPTTTNITNKKGQNGPQNPAPQQITQNPTTTNKKGQNGPQNSAPQQITQITGGSRKKKSSKK